MHAITGTPPEEFPYRQHESETIDHSYAKDACRTKHYLVLVFIFSGPINIFLIGNLLHIAGYILILKAISRPYIGDDIARIVSQANVSDFYLSYNKQLFVFLQKQTSHPQRRSRCLFLRVKCCPPTIGGQVLFKGIIN